MPLFQGKSTTKMPLFQDKNGVKMPLFQEFGAGQGDCAVLEWRHENDSAASYPGGADYGSGPAPPHALGGRGADAAAPGKACPLGSRRQNAGAQGCAQGCPPAHAGEVRYQQGRQAG